MSFLDEDYLLESDIASSLYDSVKDLPIVDSHSHADVPEIVDNEGWNDIWQVEGATDHYVWELMRRRGVPEREITGDAPDKKKWFALAEVFPDFVGNPTYEWVHLDLKRRFGIEKTISGDTAAEIWEETSSALSREEMKPQSLLKEMNVEAICSTDEPTSDLSYHERAADELEGIKILPTWRPDRLLKIEGDSWLSAVQELGRSTGRDTANFEGFLQALEETHDYFDRHGCLASDHGLNKALSKPVGFAEARDVFQKALRGEELGQEEIESFKAFLLYRCGKMNEESGWVTQLHIGPVRNYRRSLYGELGADAGGDVGKVNLDITENLRYFLNAFDGNLEIVLYYIDPAHLPAMATLARAFPNVSLGAPWWFNDSPYGIGEQFDRLSTIDLWANHAGMVSDSRKLLSYGSRIEMFRRTVCNSLARLVRRGQAPYGPVERVAKSVSYDRPRKLFGFDEISKGDVRGKDE